MLVLLFSTFVGFIDIVKGMRVGVVVHIPWALMIDCSFDMMAYCGRRRRKRCSKNSMYAIWDDGVVWTIRVALWSSGMIPA
jgi:hypothetical protein